MILKAEPIEMEDFYNESFPDFDEERFLMQTESIRNAYVTQDHPELVHRITEPGTLTLKTNEAVAVSSPPSPSVPDNPPPQTLPLRNKSVTPMATSSVGKLPTKRVKQKEAKRKSNTPMVASSPSALGGVSNPTSASVTNATAASALTSSVASLSPRLADNKSPSISTGKSASRKRKAGGGGGKGVKRGRSNIEDVTELYNDEEDEQVLCGICSSWDPPEEVGGDGGGATTEWIGCDCDR